MVASTRYVTSGSQLLCLQTALCVCAAYSTATRLCQHICLHYTTTGLSVFETVPALFPSAGGKWKLAWGIGGTAHLYAPETLAHMVALECQQSSDNTQHINLEAVAAQQTLQWMTNPQLAPGMQISAVGSPFGALSPAHFAHSMVRGVVSNRWPASADADSQSHLLTADIRSMPGMEGSPVFNAQGELAALLLPPLLSMDFRAEVCAFSLPSHLCILHRTAAVLLAEILSCTAHCTCQIQHGLHQHCPCMLTQKSWQPCA